MERIGASLPSRFSISRPHPAKLSPLTGKVTVFMPSPLPVPLRLSSRGETAPPCSVVAVLVPQTPLLQERLAISPPYCPGCTWPHPPAAARRGRKRCLASHLPASPGLPAETSHQVS